VSLTVRADFSPAERAAGQIAGLADGVLGRVAAAEAVNEVTTRWQPLFQRAMNAGLNLTDAYVASKMSSTPATAVGTGAVRAEIATRGDLTIIGHYPHQQLREGNGRRGSGVRVEIKRGAAVIEPRWFLMRLRTGTEAGDREGLFVRTSAGRVKHLYGVSPYSLFRFQTNRLEGEMADDLAATAAARMGAAIDQRMSP
jgi:hypothetical protein